MTPFNGRWSVAKARIQAWAPYLMVRHKDWLTCFADEIDHLDHLHHNRLEILTGHREFDETFEILGANHAFARALFTEDMAGSMLETSTYFALEICGDQYILYTRLLAPRELPGLFDATAAFDAHVPASVTSEYAIP